MGPHPAVAAVRRALRHALTTGPGRVMVACSGGADSLALAAALAFEAPRAGVHAGLVTVDHGLQPGSAAQAARVAAIGYELGLDPVEIVPVVVDGPGGPEAAARTARYAALDALAAALDAAVLLAHTRDDQAETVLLGLGRGSGPRSLAGMRPAQGRYLRPLLALGRDVTTAACAALGLPVWDDPHNSDPAFRRVRVRREVLPVLEQVLGPGVAAALARTAELMRDDLDALDGLAHLVARQLRDQGRVLAAYRPELGLDQGHEGRDGAAGDLDVHQVAGLPRALRTRVLRLWAADRGAEPLSAERTAALDALVCGWHGQGPVHLPGGLRVARVSGKLVVQPAPQPDQE